MSSLFGTRLFQLAAAVKKPLELVFQLSVTARATDCLEPQAPIAISALR
jgi:hypothetical protein